MAALDHDDSGVMVIRTLPAPNASRGRKNWQYIKENWLLFVIGGPGLIFILVFNYLPLMGNIIAFQDRKWYVSRRFQRQPVDLPKEAADALTFFSTESNWDFNPHEQFQIDSKALEVG